MFVRGYSFENGILKCPDETVGTLFIKDGTNFTKVNYSICSDDEFSNKRQKLELPDREMLLPIEK